MKIKNIVSEQISKTGFFSGSISTLFESPEQVLQSLESSYPHWERLETDKYMRDGGTYRQRRFGEVEFDSAADTFEFLEPRPHYQPESINSLNGGVARVFEPTEKTFQETEVFKAIVMVLGRELSRLEGGCDWRINVHQVKISSNDSMVGKPVPEGIHRDGISYGILLLMGRKNIASGGHTTLFSPKAVPLFERTLLNSGDCLIYNDRLFLHDTSAIQAIQGETAARDMFIVEFTRPEDETQVVSASKEAGAA